MWETIAIFVGIFVVLSAGLWFFISQTTRKRNDVIAAGKFDFDAFKARELARRGIHDTTRIGKSR
jgi:hypothetical protein